MASLPELLVGIKAEVGAVGKGERNAQQGFNFRGIDAVINAVAPALINHGVSIIPKVATYEFGTVEVGAKRTPMGHARVVVEYTLIGPEGDSLMGSAPGEAMDSGDKATAKAMSVALRTFLLQALSLPTTEPDPDAVAYQRTDPHPVNVAVGRVQAAWMAAHDGALDLNALSADYASRYGGDVRQASAEELDAYAVVLGAPPPPTVQDHLNRATEVVAPDGSTVTGQEPIKVKEGPKS